jgi:hypothetical protein
MKLEGQFDALLWLGPTRTFAEIPAAHCADERYMAMRLAPMAIGNRQASADRFKQQCANRVLARGGNRFDRRLEMVWLVMGLLQFVRRARC